jgi:predicted GIY-YIG superfamily endonuclease
MFFCYLLKSLNEKYLGETYIGFTDDPLKRIRQHNGIIKGGAKKTSKKRPWSIVLVISNFPNKILALKFEWAWQNPFVSTFTSEKVTYCPLIHRRIKSLIQMVLVNRARIKLNTITLLSLNCLL